MSAFSSGKGLLLRERETFQDFETKLKQTSLKRKSEKEFYNVFIRNMRTQAQKNIEALKETQRYFLLEVKSLVQRTLPSNVLALRLLEEIAGTSLNPDSIQETIERLHLFLKAKQNSEEQHFEETQNFQEFGFDEGFEEKDSTDKEKSEEKEKKSGNGVPKPQGNAGNKKMEVENKESEVMKRRIESLERELTVKKEEEAKKAKEVDSINKKMGESESRIKDLLLRISELEKAQECFQNQRSKELMDQEEKEKGFLEKISELEEELEAFQNEKDQGRIEQEGFLERISEMEEELELLQKEKEDFVEWKAKVLREIKQTHRPETQEPIQPETKEEDSKLIKEVIKEKEELVQKLQESIKNQLLLAAENERGTELVKALRNKLKMEEENNGKFKEAVARLQSSWLDEKNAREAVQRKNEESRVEFERLKRENEELERKLEEMEKSFMEQRIIESEERETWKGQIEREFERKEEKLKEEMEQLKQNKKEQREKERKYIEESEKVKRDVENNEGEFEKAQRKLADSQKKLEESEKKLEKTLREKEEIPVSPKKEQAIEEASSQARIPPSNHLETPTDPSELVLSPHLSELVEKNAALGELLEGALREKEETIQELMEVRTKCSFLEKENEQLNEFNEKYEAAIQELFEAKETAPNSPLRSPSFAPYRNMLGQLEDIIRDQINEIKILEDFLVEKDEKLAIEKERHVKTKSKLKEALKKVQESKASQKKEALKFETENEALKHERDVLRTSMKSSLKKGRFSVQFIKAKGSTPTSVVDAQEENEVQGDEKTKNPIESAKKQGFSSAQKQASENRFGESAQVSIAEMKSRPNLEEEQIIDKPELVEDEGMSNVSLSEGKEEVASSDRNISSSQRIPRRPGGTLMIPPRQHFQNDEGEYKSPTEANLGYSSPEICDSDPEDNPDEIATLMAPGSHERQIPCQLEVHSGQKLNESSLNTLPSELNFFEADAFFEGRVNEQLNSIISLEHYIPKNKESQRIIESFLNETKGHFGEIRLKYLEEMKRLNKVIEEKDKMLEEAKNSLKDSKSMLEKSKSAEEDSNEEDSNGKQGGNVNIQMESETGKEEKGKLEEMLAKSKRETEELEKDLNEERSERKILEENLKKNEAERKEERESIEREMKRQETKNKEEIERSSVKLIQEVQSKEEKIIEAKARENLLRNEIASLKSQIDVLMKEISNVRRERDFVRDETMRTRQEGSQNGEIHGEMLETNTKEAVLNQEVRFGGELDEKEEQINQMSVSLHLFLKENEALKLMMGHANDDLCRAMEENEFHCRELGRLRDRRHPREEQSELSLSLTNNNGNSQAQLMNLEMKVNELENEKRQLIARLQEAEIQLQAQGDWREAEEDESERGKGKEKTTGKIRRNKRQGWEGIDEVQSATKSEKKNVNEDLREKENRIQELEKQISLMESCQTRKSVNLPLRGSTHEDMDFDLRSSEYFVRSNQDFSPLRMGDEAASVSQLSSKTPKSNKRNIKRENERAEKQAKYRIEAELKVQREAFERKFQRREEEWENRIKKENEEARMAREELEKKLKIEMKKLEKVLERKTEEMENLKEFLGELEKKLKAKEREIDRMEKKSKQKGNKEKVKE